MEASKEAVCSAAAVAPAGNQLVPLEGGKAAAARAAATAAVGREGAAVAAAVAR